MAASKWAGFSHKTAHKVGVAAAGGYHVGKRVPKFHPFNLAPKPNLGGPVLTRSDREKLRVLSSHGLMHIAMGRKINVGGSPAYSTRTERVQSRGGQHTASSGRPGTRKSMRGPSAPRRRRDEEEDLRRRK